MESSWISISLTGTAMAALAATAAFWLAHPPVSEAKPPQIELSAAQSGANVILSWDPRSPALARVRQVYLTIGDGPARHRYALTAAQVQSGSVRYAPTWDPVSFSLEAPQFRETLVVVRQRTRKQ